MRQQMVSRHKRLKLTRKFLMATIGTRNDLNCRNFLKNPIWFSFLTREIYIKKNSLVEKFKGFSQPNFESWRPGKCSIFNLYSDVNQPNQGRTKEMKTNLNLIKDKTFYISYIILFSFYCIVCCKKDNMCPLSNYISCDF